MKPTSPFFFFFFFNDTATTEIYTLSLHDALPISVATSLHGGHLDYVRDEVPQLLDVFVEDRKSTRLNSSHDQISYAVFCLKKKKKTDTWGSSQPSTMAASSTRYRGHTRS